MLAGIVQTFFIARVNGKVAETTNAPLLVVVAFLDKVVLRNKQL